MGSSIRSLFRGSGSLILGVFGGVAASIFMHARYAVPERRPVTWVEFPKHPADPVTDRLVDAVDFDNAAIQDVLDSFAQSQKLKINPVWEQLKTIHIDRDATISLHLKNVTVAQVLDRILAIAGPEDSAAWVLQDGFITISDQESIDRFGPVTTRLYDISVLMAKSQQFTLRFPPSAPPVAKQSTMQATYPAGEMIVSENQSVSVLTDEIKSYYSGSGSTNTGNASFSYVGNGKILITQTQVVHDRLQRFLALLEKNQ